MKIKTNDQVKVLSGKDRGKSGKVIQVFPEKRKVVVEGLNKIKRHLRPRQRNEKGQTIELSAPLPASVVMLMCPSCHRPTRVGYRLAGGKKERVCRRCQVAIE